MHKFSQFHWIHIPCVFMYRGYVFVNWKLGNVLLITHNAAVSWFEVHISFAISRRGAAVFLVLQWSAIGAYLIRAVTLGLKNIGFLKCASWGEGTTLSFSFYCCTYSASNLSSPLRMAKKKFWPNLMVRKVQFWYILGCKCKNTNIFIQLGQFSAFKNSK